MSNDSSRPKPDPERIDNTTPLQFVEGTEIDLWDLDPLDSEFATPSETKINIPAPEAITPAAISLKKAAPDADAAAETPNDDLPSGAGETSELKALLPSISSLSPLEKIAIFTLFAALVLGATLSIIHFSKQMPTRPYVAEKIDYPVTGEIVRITGSSTFWRAPVTTGETPDVVRRGTKLIPVLKLKLSSKSGAVRVFFRNEDGLVIGDGITRAVNGDEEITVAATAGFEDVGMHTAYRMGDSKQWVVQVFEGTEETAPREKFRKVLETEISTEIR